MNKVMGLGVALIWAMPVMAAAVPPPTTAHHDDDDDDGDDDDGPHLSGPIVVTAHQLDAARASVDPDLGASTYTLTNDAIEKRPSGESANLVNVLLQMPGVAQGGAGEIRVRGQRNLQYRINNNILPDGLSDPADTLRARFADRIELVTGALPAQYGLQTGGVVNITTKSGVYEHGGEVELYGGTQGRFEPAFEVAGASGATNYYVSGSYLRSDAGLPSADAGRVPLHDHTDQGDGLAYLDRIIDAHSRVALIVGLSDDTQQTPHPRGGSDTWGGQQRRTGQYGMLSYQRSDDGLTLQMAGFLSHSTQRQEPDVAGDLLFLGLARGERTGNLSAGVQAEAVYDVGPAHKLRAGLVATWRRASVDSIYTVLAQNAPLTLSGQFAATRQETGVYVEDEWHPASRLTVNYGARFDDVSGQGGGQAVSPRASLVWVPYDGTVAHVGYARYFVPAPQEQDGIAPALLTGTSGALPSPTQGALRPERDDLIDAGVTQKIDELTLGLDAWWRRSTDLLDETQVWGNGAIQPYAIGQGRGWGIEASANWAEGPFAAWGNVAISRLEGRGIVAGQAPFTPAQIAMVAARYVPVSADQRITASAGAAWHLEALRLSVDGTYGSGLPRTLAAGTPNGASLPSWVQINLAAVYRLKGLWGHRLDVRLDVLNALDDARPLRDGTSLSGGLAQWAPRRGVFAGVEQSF